MSTKCEICNKECSEEEFQKHLFDEHNILFCQYIGLISNKLSFKEYVIQPVKCNTKKKKIK